MAAVFAPVEQVEATVKAANAQVPDLTSPLSISIAAYNGAHIVISGPAEQVAEIVTGFEAQNVRCMPPRTSHAFHSALLEPALDAFEEFAATIHYQPAERTLISNLTGEPLAVGSGH